MTDAPRTGFAKRLPLIAILVVAVIGAFTLRDYLSFEALRDNREALLAFRDANYLAAVLGFGIGTMNCLLYELYPIWKSFYTAVTRPLLILSAVIYIYEDLPVAAQNLLWFNPLVHITGMSRSGYFTYYEPDYVSVIYILLIALPAVFFGMLLLRRNYRKLLMI
jgi:capsular polysaccharide transport system permease protein